MNVMEFSIPICDYYGFLLLYLLLVSCELAVCPVLDRRFEEDFIAFICLLVFGIKFLFTP